MEREEPSEVENEIRRRFELGERGAAATVALRAHGPELFAYLLTFHRDETMASERSPRPANASGEAWRASRGGRRFERGRTRSLVTWR